MSKQKAVAAVSRASQATLSPQTSITIAVDTAYVAAQQGKNIGQGIYMMDNRVRNGSSGEGSPARNHRASTVLPSASTSGRIRRLP